MAFGMGHGSGEFGEVQLNDIENLIQIDGFLRQNIPSTLPCNV